MARVSTRENKNIYQLTRENLKLTRETASELLESIPPERIEKIENERSFPHPDEVLTMAEKYKKPGIGGSDAHRPDCIGTGYTILPERVTCETELIALIRSKAAIEAGGVLYGKTAKDKMGPAHKILTYSFWFYNKGGALLKKRKRTLKGKIENPATPIDPIEIPYLHNIKKQK